VVAKSGLMTRPAASRSSVSIRCPSVEHACRPPFSNNRIFAGRQSMSTKVGGAGGTSHSGQPIEKY